MALEAERVVGLYRRHGLAWAADRGNRLFETAWLDAFQALMPPGGDVLDIGCGSGEPIARHLLAQGLDVSGIDASPALIYLCRERFPDREWRIGDMRGMSLGRVFDGLLAWDSFFHLSQDDQRGMFPVFRQHAAPGAALMFTSGPEAGEAVGSYAGEPLYHASLDGAEYRALLEELGFALIAHRVEDPECGGRTVWLARLR